MGLPLFFRSVSFVRMKKLLLSCLLLLLSCFFVSAFAASSAPVLVMGSPDAPVTIDDYSSLGCPHCADFHLNTLPKIKKDFIDTGKVKFVFHEFPLDKASVDGALLVGCVPAAQAWDAINLLYYQQDKWAHDEKYDDKLVGYGQMLGLTEAKVKACLADDKKRDAFLQGRVDAVKKYNIEGTPTFIFNDGKARMMGAQPYDQVANAIKQLSLSKAISE